MITIKRITKLDVKVGQPSPHTNSLKKIYNHGYLYLKAKFWILTNI